MAGDEQYLDGTMPIGAAAVFIDPPESTYLMIDVRSIDHDAVNAAVRAMQTAADS